MRRSINKERQLPNTDYLDSRAAAIEAIARLDARLDAAADDVIALLADIPVRSRLITLTCLNDGTVGIYYSSGEKVARLGRSSKRLPPAGKLLLSRLALIARTFAPVSAIDSVSESAVPVKTRVYFRCRDGFRRAEYEMDHVNECGDDIRSLDAMLKDLLRMIRRSKERLF